MHMVQSGLLTVRVALKILSLSLIAVPLWHCKSDIYFLNPLVFFKVAKGRSLSQHALRQVDLTHLCNCTSWSSTARPLKPCTSLQATNTAPQHVTWYWPNQSMCDVISTAAPRQVFHLTEHKTSHHTLTEAVTSFNADALKLNEASDRAIKHAEHNDLEANLCNQNLICTDSPLPYRHKNTSRHNEADINSIKTQCFLHEEISVVNLLLGVSPHLLKFTDVWDGFIKNVLKWITKNASKTVKGALCFAEYDWNWQRWVMDARAHRGFFISHRLVWCSKWGLNKVMDIFLQKLKDRSKTKDFRKTFNLKRIYKTTYVDLLFSHSYTVHVHLKSILKKFKEGSCFLLGVSY